MQALHTFYSSQQNAGYKNSGSGALPGLMLDLGSLKII